MNTNGPRVECVPVGPVPGAMARYLPHQNASSVSSDGVHANTVTKVCTLRALLGVVTSG
jgi:hypothetical protein